jgi:hypothetical protein
VSTRAALFQVPEGEVPGLRRLAHVSPDVMSKVASALARAEPSLAVDVLAASAAQQAELDVVDVRSVVVTLWRLAIVQRRLELSADQFVTALTRSLGENSEWTPEDAQSWGAVSSTLRGILSPDLPLAVAAKAADLVVEQHLLFCTARVLTDLRPVFDDSASEVQAFVPVHTLAVTCHEGPETRRIYIAMDSNDVAQLREHLERAERKEKILKSRLERAAMPTIGTRGGADERSAS